MPDSPPNVYSIGVLADTHNRWYPRIGELFADVDEIWHLGDICREDVLDELRALGREMHVVLGNNDFGLDYPISRTLQRHAEAFRLIHIAPRETPTDVQWLLHGHTHRPRNEVVDGVHYFNPGPAGLANKGAPLSVGFLRSVDDGPFEAEIVSLKD